MNATTKSAILILIGLVVTVAVMLQPPIAQDPAYHQFADQRGWAGLPHVLNLLSNVPYLLIGILGIKRLASGRPAVIIEPLRFLYQLFFISLALIGLGSGWYHWAPDNASLVWDRLPIAIAFVTLFSIILAEHLHPKLGLTLFPLLLFLAISSVGYWYWTETLGQGDMRPYILVQLLPMILLALLLLMYPSALGRSRVYWLVLACYLVAKVFEVLDGQIYELGGLVSGHTLKHLVSAIGPWLFYRSLDSTHQAPLPGASPRGV